MEIINLSIKIMTDEINTILTTGISTTAQAGYEAKDLAPNNYLTIIWKNSAGEQFNNVDINDEQAMQFTNDLNNAIEQGINNNKVSYAGANRYVNIESIAKYLAQNIIPTSPKRTIVNALIGLATGSKTKLPEETKSLIVNVFGEVAEKVARSFGFSDPHEIFASIASENTIQFFGELGNKAKDYLENCISKFKNRKGKSETSKIAKDTEAEGKKYIGFIFGLTTSDTESYEISIPRKKVEDGSDYTTHLLPQSFKKDFNVILTNKVLTSEFDREEEIKNIEVVKNKLIEIAQSKILFDIYIRLSNGQCYKRSNVYFSSLSFTKDESSGNNYTCSFSIEPIQSFKSKIAVSNRKYFPTPSKTISDGFGSLGRGISGFGGGPSGGASRNMADSLPNGNSIKVGYIYGGIKPEYFSDFKSVMKTAVAQHDNILYDPNNTTDPLLFTNTAVPAYTTSVKLRGPLLSQQNVASGSVLAQIEDTIIGDGSPERPNKNFRYLAYNVYVDENGYIHGRKGIYKVINAKKALKGF